MPELHEMLEGPKHMPHIRQIQVGWLGASGAFYPWPTEPNREQEPGSYMPVYIDEEEGPKFTPVPIDEGSEEPLMEYATFTEHNEWEGETWRFYIPIEGNETALTELRALVDQTDESYHLDLVPIPERDVDARVAGPDDCGYMHGHNKLTGRLTVPTLGSLREAHGEHWADEAFYKGGIKKLMEDSADVS